MVSNLASDPPVSISRGQRQRPRGCNHLCAARVHDSGHPSKWRKTSASMHDKRMRQRDAARMVLVPA